MPALPRRALALLLLVAGCVSPARPVRPLPPAAEAASHQHYRAYASADALAAALRAGSPAFPMVSAHRGGPAPYYPENALAAFEHALHFGPALVEVDVRLTADSALVLLHDDALDRTTTGAGPLAARTLAHVRRLRLRDGNGAPTPSRVPTLAEALAWAEGRAVLLLDRKAGVSPERLVAAVRAAGAFDRVILIGYEPEEWARYHALAPEAVLSVTAPTLGEAEALLAGPVPTDRVIAFAGVGGFDPEVVARLHAAGIAVQAATFGEIDERAAREGAGVYRPWLEAGVDVIATDRVPLAGLAVTAARGARAGATR